MGYKGENRSPTVILPVGVGQGCRTEIKRQDCQWEGIVEGNYFAHVFVFVTGGYK